MDSSHPQETAVDDAVVYVEELANADDYWLSITDAARVCRVQDVSIRRAINRKSLPVRRQRAGQNKRTRFVRASDLTLAGFPILDESAMITTEIGKVDVLSIPRQQQQIVQDHQALMLKLGAMQEALASSQHQLAEGLRQQQESFQEALHSAQTEQAYQLATTKTALTQAQEQLQRALTEATQHFTAEQQTLHQELAQEQNAARARAEQTQLAIKSLRQDLAEEQTKTISRDDHLQADVNALQTTLHKYQTEAQGQLNHLLATQQNLQHTMDTTIQRVEQEAQQRFLTIEQRVTENLKKIEQKFVTQFNAVTEAIAQIQQANEHFRQHTALREQDRDLTIQHMQTQLNQHAQLLPLLPYVQQRLVSEQEIALWSQLLAAQQRELERYQPLLTFLSPEHLEALTRLLAHELATNKQDEAQKTSQYEIDEKTARTI